MLSRADAVIARRDPALPGLATLLDDEALLAALRAVCPGKTIEGVEVNYARYRPGATCLVGCQLGIGGSRVVAYARTYSPSATSRVEKALRSTGVPGPLGPGRFVLADGATVVSIFPNDRRVMALPAIGRSEDLDTLLGELLPTSESLRAGAALEPLVYRPEHGFVGKLVGCNGLHAVLKLYTNFTYGATPQHSEPFASRGSLRVARVIARSDRHRAVVFEWLSGCLLSEAIHDPAFEVSTMSSVGRALAELHAQELPGLTPLTPATTSESLRATATMIGSVCPQLDASARHLAERLGARVLDQPTVHRRLHGDFHPGQVLLDGGAVGFLDFDEGLAGDPTLDLGTFLAHLAREVIRGGLSAKHVGPLAEALLGGYEGAIGPPVRERLPLALAMGLFRLAPRCFRHREQDWPDRMAALLERAEESVASAPHRTSTSKTSASQRRSHAAA